MSLLRPVGGNPSLPHGNISQAFDGQYVGEPAGWLKRNRTADRGQRTRFGTATYYPHIHLAIDYVVAVGTPVWACHGGKIVAQFTSQPDGSVTTYLRVLVTPKYDLYATYWHLKAGSFRQPVGTIVKRGKVIALSGATGWVTGPHLHFELWRAPHGTRINDLWRVSRRFDPQPFIDGKALTRIV